MLLDVDGFGCGCLLGDAGSDSSALLSAAMSALLDFMVAASNLSLSSELKVERYCSSSQG